jgi:SP family general alpha glucoside:H+ symporter-like MFS transporter
MGNATYFLKQAGLSESTASTLNLIMFAIGALGTISSWWLMQFAGRRTIYLWGSATLNVLMLVTGVLGTIKSKGDGKNYATGAILILFTGLYDLTVGPVCYSLVAEIGSTRLRAKTVIHQHHQPVHAQQYRLELGCQVGLRLVRNRYPRNNLG